MTAIESQQLIFNSILDCLAAGQDRYKELFIFMLNKIDNLNELFSEEELFLKIGQLATPKIKIDIFESFLTKINNLEKILKITSHSSGNNILHILLKNKIEFPIIQLFLKKSDTDVLNHQNKQGDTPLHFAVKYTKKLVVVEGLLKNSVSLSIQNKDKNTPLHYAVMLLTHNREFDPFVLEQQLLIFNRLSLSNNNISLQLKNKQGNTVLHQMIADIDHYRGVINTQEEFTFEDLLKSFKTRKSEFKRIVEFFRCLYPNAIQTITTKIKNSGVNLKEKNDLNLTAFQLSFIKKHFSATKALFAVNDSFTESELTQNQFSNIALKLVKNATSENLESLKIFILAGGHIALTNTQLGHTILKHALVEQLNIELTDLLVTKGGARILENGDCTDIWKSLFFKLSQSTDNHFKVSTIQVLFHIGVNYTRKDHYGRNAEDLAKLYHIKDEFNQARKQFETYALTQVKRRPTAPQIEQNYYFN